jgi:hypothetical protein
MFERLSLWMVPAAYVGVALAAESVRRRIDRFHRLPRRIDLAAALPGSLVLAALLADVAVRGSTYIAFTKPVANHDVDDRAAVAWLMRYRQPGAVWLTTRNALPAVWWYANDDLPTLEAIVDDDPQACGPSELGETLRRGATRRALVYLGFAHNVPPSFDDTLLIRLGSLGRISAYNRFGENGHAIVVDLHDTPTGRVTLALLGATDEAEKVDVSGCIAVSPAQRW